MITVHYSSDQEGTLDFIWILKLAVQLDESLSLLWGSNNCVGSVQVHEVPVVHTSLQQTQVLELETEIFGTSVVVMVQVVGSSFNSVSDLSVVDVSLNILDVLPVESVIVDLMVLLLGVDIFGVAVEVDKCVHFKDLLLINLL